MFDFPYCANAREKGMNPSFHVPAMAKHLDRQGSLTLFFNRNRYTRRKAIGLELELAVGLEKDGLCLAIFIQATIRIRDTGNHENIINYWT